MTDTIEVEAPESTSEDQVKTVVERQADLLEARRARLLQDDSEPEATEAEDDTEEVDVDVPDVDEEEVDDEDVLSQSDTIDVDSLTEEDIRELAKQKGIDLEPKENSAWAAQRRKIKELEAEIDSVRKAKDEALKIQSVSTAETQLQQKEANIKYWNRKLLTESETQYDGDAEVRGVTHDGKFYKANEILDFLDKEEAQLPNLRKEAMEAERARESVGNLDGTIDSVRERLSLSGDALDAYDELLSNPNFEIVKTVVPQFGAELVELLGLAALQKAGPKKKRVIAKRKAPKETKDNISPKVASSRPADSSSKSSKIKRLEKIASDPKTPIAARRQARLDIRHLKIN